MSALQLDRRGFVALSAGACLASHQARADQVGDPVIAYWNEPIAIGAVAPGDWLLVMIDGDPVFVRRRTPAQIAAARATPLSSLPDPALDEARAPIAQWLVVSGVCTHAGCQVQGGLGPYDGWQCFCHGSSFDLSGRVRHGPARRNLPVIAHAIAGQTVTLRRE